MKADLTNWEAICWTNVNMHHYLSYNKNHAKKKKKLERVTSLWYMTTIFHKFLARFHFQKTTTLYHEPIVSTCVFFLHFVPSTQSTLSHVPLLSQFTFPQQWSQAKSDKPFHFPRYFVLFPWKHFEVVWIPTPLLLKHCFFFTFP